jgi:poly-gamma-glutamate synthesis protein (capsule biosynthesis protein)
MKICFAGDLFLGGDFEEMASTEVINSKLFSTADVRVVNLEQSISDSSLELSKGTLHTPASSAEKLSHLGIDVVNLANNHIQDKGPAGILDTIDALEENNISYFGAGRDLVASREPHWLTSDLVVLGYCDFEKPYLNQVLVAGIDSPGVNPLREDTILEDLSLLPKSAKAILYFHWGREHVSLPPSGDISLARNLLKHEKVCGIIGMHAHQIQGILLDKNKPTFMCIGNFLFPNFYIKPRNKIYNPSNREKKLIMSTTYQYHRVFTPTYKKWRSVNRQSMVVAYNTETNEWSHEFVCQHENSPSVHTVDLKTKKWLDFKINVLSMIMRLTPTIYLALYKTNSALNLVIWWLYNIKIYWGQLGAYGFIKIALDYAKARFR